MDGANVVSPIPAIDVDTDGGSSSSTAVAADIGSQSAPEMNGAYEKLQPESFSHSGSQELHPAARVRRLLEDGQPTVHGPKLSNRILFTQLDVLVHFTGGRLGWKEMSRWLKYKETVETASRWSKPHVATTAMHSLTELRQVFSSGHCAVGLGLTGANNAGPNFIIDSVIETLKRSDSRKLSDSHAQLLADTVLKPHKQLNRQAKKKKDKSDDSGDEKRRKKRLRRRSGEIDIAEIYFDYPEGVTPDNLKDYKANKRLRKKLPQDCEATNILVGQVDFLEETQICFCRFDDVIHLAKVTEVDVPTRFVFLVLGPTSSTNIWEMTELGSALATLLSDKVFCDVALKAKTRQDLLDGMDEFMDTALILPPSIWDPNTRLEPPTHKASMEQIMSRLDESKRQPGIPECPEQEEGAPSDTTLLRTGRIFGGLIRDIKNRYPQYLSDIKDGLHVQCIASTIFLFFACITPIVTFGGLMGQKTDNWMATIECLMSGAFCGCMYALFAGQPLNIVGATGPLLVFESIIFRISDDNDWDFLSFRFWIGMWITLILLIIVMFDLSFLVRYITRFTEECFSILISIIFIYEAFKNMYNIYNNNLVFTLKTRDDEIPSCFCTPADFLITTNITGNTTGDFDIFENVTSNFTYAFPETCISYMNRIAVSRDCVSLEDCEGYWQGSYDGPGCSKKRVTESIPDVFFLSIILWVGTFVVAIGFRNFKTCRYFTAMIRTVIGDFAVFLSLCIWTGIDYAFGIDTPKLLVPSTVRTTRDDRGWVVNPLDVSEIWLIPVAILPALLATILCFLDHQITSVIVNRKEHKLKKGHGYHLDLFVVAISMGICSLLGLPWFLAATVRALTHVKSLFRVSEVSIPGEKPQMIGVREQRVTGFSIHLLIGLSTLLTAILKLIPMPVLYGVFLYMGITSLSDVQFIQRLGILFVAPKNQPDYVFLRHVKMTKVHIFTIIQLIAFIAMWAIKQIEVTSILFPFMLIVLMLVRKMFDFIYTQSELYWLDHLMPEEQLRLDEDRRKKLEQEEAEKQHAYLNGGVQPRSVTAAETAIDIESEKL